MGRYACCVIFVTLLGGASYAQTASDCAALMKFGVYDKYRTFTTETHYKQIRKFFENNQFSSRQQAQSKAAELGLGIEGVLDLNFNGTSSSSNFEQWRQHLIRSSYQEALSVGLSSTSVETISGRITGLVETCLTQKGVHAYVIPAADNQNFTVTVDFVPLSSEHPLTTGSITVTPSSVASQCSPNNILGQQRQIGPQGVSLSCRRLATETVNVIVNTQDGSPTFTYDAYVVPRPSIQFTATRDIIQSGETTRLNWEVRNALRITLVDFEQVPEVGFRDVTPARTTEYKLNVTALDGQSTTTSKTITVTPPPPVLVGARVHFHTTDDNKDHDTNVTVAINYGGHTIAAVSGTWGEFPDNSDSGWKEMIVIERPRKDAVIGASSVRLVEAPVGHDEWHFNWSLELTFSDGSTKRYDFGGGNVDYDRTTITQPL